MYALARTPADHIFKWTDFSTVPSTTRLLKFVNDIKSTGFIPEVRPDVEVGRQACNCPITPNWEQFLAMQPLACPRHIQTSLTSRLTKARALVPSPSKIQYMMFLLGPEWYDDRRNICNIVDTEASLIHTASDIMFRLEECMFRNRLSEDEFPRWLSFAMEVIQNCQDLHVLERRQSWETQFMCHIHDESRTFTPLVRIICNYTNIHGPSSCMKAIRTWIRMLKQTGVDLCEYGQRENQLLHEHHLQTMRDFEWYLKFEYSGRRPDGIWRLLGFKFGPDVEDWDIWWNEPTDDFTGDFWALVEDPPIHVPGEWIETEP